MIKTQTLELRITLISDTGKRMHYRSILDLPGGSVSITNEGEEEPFLEIHLGKMGEREVKEADTMRISL